MNSKRALFMLMINQKKLKDGWKLTDLNTLESVSIEECYDIVMKDLDRLEKLEQENKELKEQVNHLNKVIEVMKNPSKLDCTHMFDNCKELKPLTEKKEHKMTSLEGLKEICINCRNNINQIPSKGDRPYKECPYRGISNDYCEEYETIKKDLELLEILKKHYNVNSLTTSLDSFISIFIYKTDKDFEKIKEWLENE